MEIVNFGFKRLLFDICIQALISKIAMKEIL
jgi:hypothetical protein